MAHQEINGKYRLTDDRDVVNSYMEELCDLVSKQHWGHGEGKRIRRTIRKSLENSRVFVLLDGNPSAGRTTLVGCCRLITDSSILAYLFDVIIDEPYRRKGLGKRMIQSVMKWPDLAETRRWLLDTDDEHEFYKTIGFEPVPHPEKYMTACIPYPTE